jgi:hypothetical protein
MAVTGVLFNAFKRDLMLGIHDMDTDTYNVSLHTSSWTPNIDTDEDFADVDNEVTGTGYTAGGAALASLAVTMDTTDNEGVFDAVDTVWTTSTITARYAIIRQANGGAASADPLVGYLDFGADVTSTAGDFTITWAAEGIVNIG